MLLAGGLCYSLIRLFEIRFSQGDVYAPYSSLRADGLGTKALHDSLEDLVRVERNTRPFSRLRADDGTVLFLLGVQDGRLQEESDMSDVQTLVHNGARMVMSFLPVAEKTPLTIQERRRKMTKRKRVAGRIRLTRKTAARKRDEQIDWRKLWIVKTALFETVPHHAMAAGAGMEPQISWHTLLYFRPSGSGMANTLFVPGEAGYHREDLLGRDTWFLWPIRTYSAMRRLARSGCHVAFGVGGGKAAQGGF